MLSLISEKQDCCPVHMHMMGVTMHVVGLLGTRTIVYSRKASA